MSKDFFLAWIFSIIFSICSSAFCSQIFCATYGTNICINIFDCDQSISVSVINLVLLRSILPPIQGIFLILAYYCLLFVKSIHYWGLVHKRLLLLQLCHQYLSLRDMSIVRCFSINKITWKWLIISVFFNY